MRSVKGHFPVFQGQRGTGEAGCTLVLYGAPPVVEIEFTYSDSIVIIQSAGDEHVCRVGPPFPGRNSVRVGQSKWTSCAKARRGKRAMNAGFRGAAAQYFKKELPITHQQEVCKLYRHSLKLMRSWAVDRGIFLQKATEIRAEFDEGVNCGPDEANARKRAVYVRLAQWYHPDVYTRAYLPGGSDFMRNPALPLEFCYPDGVPQEVRDEYKGVGMERELDMSHPTEGRMSKAGKVLVNFNTKSIQ